jgi:ML-like domain
MRSWQISIPTIAFLLTFGTLPARVLGAQILQTSGFSTCLDNSNLTVNTVDIQYNNDNKTVSFNVAGSSSITVNVTATLNVTAYGSSVYSNNFNPCDTATFVSQLCPGTFTIFYMSPPPDCPIATVPKLIFV